MSGKGMSGKGRMWKCESCGLSAEASIPNCVCGRKKPQPAMKTGDWECPNCAEVVFANKIYCTVCSYRKHDGMSSFVALKSVKELHKLGGFGDKYQVNGLNVRNGGCIVKATIAKDGLINEYNSRDHNLGWFNTYQHRDSWACPNCNYHVIWDKDYRCDKPNPHIERGHLQARKGDWRAVHVVVIVCLPQRLSVVVVPRNLVSCGWMGI